MGEFSELGRGVRFSGWEWCFRNFLINAGEGVTIPKQRVGHPSKNFEQIKPKANKDTIIDIMLYYVIHIYKGLKLLSHTVHSNLFSLVLYLYYLI